MVLEKSRLRLDVKEKFFTIRMVIKWNRLCMEVAGASTLERFKVVNKIILQSGGLREAFAELDMSSEVLQIAMSPEKPYFRYWRVILNFGNAGSAHLDYPRDSDLMEAFHCNQTQTCRYKISLLKPSTKALALSCKVSIRTDGQGFLSLQYMIRNEDGQICFVEYYCCPDEDVTETEL
ncbi:LOW QUALITY PROTEIN: cell cycle checkpoint protein RAD1 [Calypte anna]|uniref:LOW QUALITY PROTEIN: cell cycle checkpoint protein RAD1 n=1 Tax=Calypte anna TaxID=9244 RepID=UPI0011C40CD9|nr:LOW QUALITY PROTEIN: cell cycle checkpoint protein RAD1 [Calypte anna]